MGKTKQNGMLHRLRRGIMCGALSCALALGMMLIMPGMGMTARAEDTFEIDGIRYSQFGNSDKCMVTGLNPNYQKSEVNIPASVINNNSTYKVIFINKGAFYGCKNIKKITLGNEMVSIGSQAFGRTNIEEIEMPESVVTVNEEIFFECNSLKKIRFKGKKPLKIVATNWLGGVNNNITIEIPEDADKNAWEKELYLERYSINITIQTYDPTASSSTSTTTSPNQEKNNSNGEAEFIKEEPVNRIPEHVCQYEWEVVREVSADQDGLEQYLCKLCGNVQSTLTIPASQYQVQELYTKVTGAGEGETVTYDTGMVHTVCDKLFTKLQQRKDITLVITYQYKGENYRTTFPAGADYTELMQDADQFYGMLGLNGRCGIVTEKN